jgi:hypothetical protein
MTTQRLRLGGEMQVVGEDDCGVTISGPLRLCPGRDVDLISGWVPGQESAIRRALVWNWRLTRVGSDGPVYEGYCRWT